MRPAELDHLLRGREFLRITFANGKDEIVADFDRPALMYPRAWRRVMRETFAHVPGYEPPRLTKPRHDRWVRQAFRLADALDADSRGRVA